MTTSTTNLSASPAATAPQPLTAAGLIGALGIVYGDIGTSPLYAFKESIGGAHGVGVSEAAVHGVLSMIFWAITLVVTLKYVTIVLRADNDGEGGIFALLALLLRQLMPGQKLRRVAIIAGLTGAAMFYGDAAITPAISVLSAVEGLEVVSPELHAFVLPVTVTIIVLLFTAQRFGTGAMGSVFGPIVALWFAVLGILGAIQIARHPEVLLAIAPWHAVRYFVDHPDAGFVIVGAVFLAVTGGEALYADLGHFGRRPIRVAWLGLVMPALLLNYFGQGALVLDDPAAVRSPLFLMAPGWLALPLVLLATAATVIASQATISGAFSLTAQAIKLGYLPRMTVVFTSATEAGQIYVAFINWTLLVLVVGLVLGFGSSSDLAAAYGIAVSVTMVVTVLGAALVARRIWNWSPAWVAIVFVPLAAIDLMFVSANTAKVMQGGWFPLGLAAFLIVLFTTWRRGRAMVAAQWRKRALALDPFIHSLTQYPPQRIEGTAVFLTRDPDDVPSALLHNLKHNRVLHERVLFLSAITENVPRIAPDEMIEARDLGDGCYAVRVRLGFNDSLDIGAIARVLERQHGIELAVEQASFFLSRESIVVERSGGMAMWRKRLFASMMRNALPAADYFRIPPNRVIEIGMQVSI